jgi:hypothetical protein
MNKLRIFQFVALTFLITGGTTAFAESDPWRLQLRNETSCEFTLSHHANSNKLKFTGNFEECDSVLEITHNQVSSKLAIVDAPAERGGSAYIVHAHGSVLKTLKISYRGTEEDTLQFRLQKNNLKLFTTKEEINLVIAADGSINIKSRKYL